MNVPSEWPSEPCTFLDRLLSFIDDQRCRKPRQLNAVRWRLMTVHPLCGTCCFMSLCWILELLGCCQIFGGKCIYAPLLLTVQLLSASPVWRFYMRACTVRVKCLDANCSGSVSTWYEAWSCFVKRDDSVGWEHFVTIKCCCLHYLTNTDVWISYIWSLYVTATCFGCLYRPSSGSRKG